MAASRRPRILFVTYGGGHVAMVLPIVRLLRDEGLADPVVVALTIAGAACRRAGVPALGSRDLLPDDPAARAEALRVGELLTAGEADHPDIDHEETVAYHGLSYLDLVGRHGEDRAAELFRESGRRAFLPISLFERVIPELGIDVVVATNSPRSEQAAIIAASRLGVPSVCILDMFGLRADWIMQPGFADRVCVLSESVRGLLVERGRSADEVVVTGNPAFDALVDVRERRADTGPHDGFRVLWASHPEPAVHPFDGTPGNAALAGDIAGELVRCAWRHPDWTIVARPHPSEHDLAIDGPANITVVAGDDLDARLAWADVVVTAVSTVGLQASLAGIPVVAVDGSVLAPDVPYAEYGFAHAADVATLGATLEQLRDDPVALDPGLARVGGATRRVADVVVGLA